MDTDIQQRTADQALVPGAGGPGTDYPAHGSESTTSGIIVGIGRQLGLRRHLARVGVVLGFVALVAVAVGAFGSGAGEEAAIGQMPPPEVSVSTVVARSVQPWDEFTGRVTAVESVELRPRVSGYVERVAYQEGQFVHKGDLLFLIDQRSYRAEYERARAELARARSAAALARSQDERTQELLLARAASQEESDERGAAADQSLAAVRAAEAALERARLDLEFTEVRSPIDGRAGRARVTAGNLAQADSTLLATVVSVDPVYVYFDTDEQTYLRYLALSHSGERAASGNAVRIGLANEAGFPHPGSVDFVDNQVDASTGTMQLRALVPNPDRLLVPGLFARVQLQAGDDRAALLIDDKAVLTDQDRKYVYVLGPGNAAVRKDIELGRSAGDLRVVTSGLAPGDQVIVNGMQKVFFEGMPVSPQRVAMGEPSPGAVHVAAGTN